MMFPVTKKPGSFRNGEAVVRNASGVSTTSSGKNTKSVFRISRSP